MSRLGEKAAAAFCDAFNQSDWATVSSAFVRLREESDVSVVEAISETLVTYQIKCPRMTRQDSPSDQPSHHSSSP